MNYEIEADFYLLTTCNFRCSYCPLSPEALGARLKVHAGNDAWQEAFEATGKTWLLHVTGGEPFLYPGFPDLCERLARRHHLSINSNLAHPQVEEFAVRVPPGRVHFINAAVHYEERARRGALDVFVARVHRLRSAGFAVLVSLVMTPELVRAYPEVAGHFRSHGLALAPKVLRGPYAGRNYPGAYTPAEKALLRSYLDEARREYAPVLAEMGEPPTINVFSDARFLDGVPSYRGRLCGSGHNFVLVAPEGTVLRCGSREQLGNLFRRDLRLLSGPRPCDATYCPYFCEKYTSSRHLGRWAPPPATPFTFTFGTASDPDGGLAP